MPQIKFTDATVKKLEPSDKATWYSDPLAKGLRLCVTSGGVKTWYVNKWDPTAQKVRQVKLAQWAARGTHTAWAKDQVGKIVLDMKEGKQKTKKEQAVERAGIPTFREAFDREMKYRRNRSAAYGGPIHERTAHDYERSFEIYLSPWANAKMTEIDTAAIQRMLDDMSEQKPYAAHKVNIVLGITFDRAERMIHARLPVLPPKLKQNPKMGDRKDTKDKDGNVRLDVTVPWDDRWKEIEAVENEHKRLCWMLRWYTGQREEMLRTLKWDDIDRGAGTMMVRTGMKKVKGKRLIAMGDQVKGWFDRLWEIRLDDCEWVFPSRRVVGKARGHLDRLDRLALTAPGDLRHLFEEAAEDVETREIVIRWLMGQSLSAGETKSLGFYATVPVERQRRIANEIASVINSRIGRSPEKVVALRAEAG